MSQTYLNKARTYLKDHNIAAESDKPSQESDFTGGDLRLADITPGIREHSSVRSNTSTTVKPSFQPAPPANVPRCLTQREISEISEIRYQAVQRSVSESLRSINEGEIARAHNDKATVSGGEPPRIVIERQQAWLATIDWSRGLRCGSTNKQCLRCTGLPCHDSTAWQAE